MSRLGIVLLVLSILCLAGCLDIYEHVSKEKNGNTNVYLKLTVAKALLEMAKSDSQKGDSDPFAEITGSGENEIYKEITDVLKGKLTRIDTELEAGMAVELSLNLKAKEVRAFLDSDDSPLIPRIDDEKIVFTFSTMNRSSSEDNQMGLALLSSYKYRLTISKSICPTISRVILSTDEFDFKPQIASLPDMFLVEVPLSYLFKASKTTQLIVYK
jgi:hypothetical protein